MTIDLTPYRPADPTHVWGVEFATPETRFSISELDALGIPRVEPAGLVSDPRARVAFRGGWTCACVATSLPLVEADMIRRGIIRECIDIYQLGWNAGGVSASAGTHDEGMMIDVGQYSRAALEVWWKWGWAMQHRTTEQGFSGHHGHGGPNGCTHGSPLATWQMQQYVRHGRNGLRSNGPAAGPTTTLPTWQDALKKHTIREELPVDQNTFNRLMTNWAKSKEGRTALAIAAVSATYGRDGADPNKSPDTVGQMIAEIWDHTVKKEKQR